MLEVLLIPVSAQVVAPAALLSWVAFGRHGSRAEWLVAVLATCAYLSAIAMAGVWLMVPWLVLAAYVLLLPLAMGRSARRIGVGAAWPRSPRGWVSFAIVAAVGAASGALAGHAFLARQAPRGVALDLHFPLRGRGYVVVNGGSRTLLNAHLVTLADVDRYRPYRGQSHGIDVVQLSAWGMYARSPMPSEPASYEVFGETIIAPCAGRVVRTMDGLADLEPPLVDREQMAGNHVLLSCAGSWILLGHMRRGSVRVQEGDTVDVGQALGEVGNSGNSDVPHLHIHAQRPATSESPFGGEPLPMRFDGRYLARNSRIDVIGGGN